MASKFNNTIQSSVTYKNGAAYNADGTPNASLTEIEAAPDPLTGLTPVYPIIDASKVKALPAPKVSRIVTTDIVNNYDWTASKNKQEIAAKLFGDKIPYVELTEMRLLGGNMVYSILQSILNIGDVFSLYKTAINDNPALQVIGDALKQAGGDAIVRVAIGATNVVESAVGIAGSVANTLSFNFFSNVAAIRDKFISNIPSNLRKDLLNPNAIQPYENLYLTELTDTRYIMPYFDNKYVDVRNVFDDSYSKKQLSTASDTINEIAGIVDNLMDKSIRIAGILEPGVYIERPKFYNFESINNPEITIKFPLLNTLNASSISKNIELIHQLTIQNKIYRKSRVLSEQPVIYQVRIPGQAYYPYAYIEQLYVNFLGTRRIRKVKIGNQEIETTIPDAYEVEIKLRCLTSDSSNFIVAEMGTNKVDISTRKVNP